MAKPRKAPGLTTEEMRLETRRLMQRLTFARAVFDEDKKLAEAWAELAQMATQRRMYLDDLWRHDAKDTGGDQTD